MLVTLDLFLSVALKYQVRAFVHYFNEYTQFTLMYNVLADQLV